MTTATCTMETIRKVRGQERGLWWRLRPMMWLKLGNHRWRVETHRVHGPVLEIPASWIYGVSDDWE